MVNYTTKPKVQQYWSTENSSAGKKHKLWTHWIALNENTHNLKLNTCTLTS